MENYFQPIYCSVFIYCMFLYTVCDRPQRRADYAAAAEKPLRRRRRFCIQRAVAAAAV